MTREQWLNQLTDALRLLFEDIARPLPTSIQVSIGWPSAGGTSQKRQVIGQCWSPHTDPKNPTHIFISPLLADPHEVGATLVHELCHAHLATPGHGAEFKKMMKLVGLDGKATATHAGPELTLRLKDLIEKLPPLVHGQLRLIEREAKDKPQTTRMLKCVCKDHPDYLVRASRKVITLAAPRCGQCGEPMMEAA